MDRVEFDYWKPRDVARLLSLVEAERRYFQELMALLPVGVALVTPTLDLSMTNRAFRRLFGLGRDTAGERRLDDLIPVPALAGRVAECLAARTARSILSQETDTAHGKRTVLVTLQPFREWDDEAQPEIIVTVEDVSEMVVGLLPAMAPAKAIEGETAAPPPPAPAAEPEIAPTPAMAAATAVIMAKLGEAATEPAPAAVAPVAPPAPVWLSDAIRWRLDAASLRFESVHISEAMSDAQLPKDAWHEGAEFWSGRVVSAHLPLVRSFYEQLLAGLPLRSVEYRATSASGSTVWLRDSVTVIRGDLGAITHLEGSTAEVTPIRQREDSSAQALKVEALTRLSGRVAHECNNLLTILSGHGEELLHSLSPDNPLRANAQEILTAGDRLSAFTRQLAAFIKNPNPEIKPVNIDTMLAECRDELRQLLPSAIRLIVNPGAGLATAHADRGLLVQALRSLTLRGAEALRGEGAVSIETNTTVAADPSAASRVALPPGHYVQISVRDTGHAIHPELLHQIFEPPVGDEPTRHDLARIYRGIREMGGDLMVSSEFDRGTSFTLLLPRGVDAVLPAPVAQPEAVEAPPAPAAPPPPVRAETILVVEDEAGIRGLIRRILSRQNFEVIEASNGRQALELAKQFEGKIDMLLTDVVMPEMGGFDLAHELLEQRPGIKVLFISGYTGLAGFDPAHLPAGAGFLQKPFTLNSLLAKVREVMGPRPN